MKTILKLFFKDSKLTRWLNQLLKTGNALWIRAHTKSCGNCCGAIVAVIITPPISWFWVTSVIDSLKFKVYGTQLYHPRDSQVLGLSRKSGAVAAHHLGGKESEYRFLLFTFLFFNLRELCSWCGITTRLCKELWAYICQVSIHRNPECVTSDFWPKILISSGDCFSLQNFAVVVVKSVFLLQKQRNIMGVGRDGFKWIKIAICESVLPV